MASMAEKTALLAPMAKARVRMTIREKVGDLRMKRKADLRLARVASKRRIGETSRNCSLEFSGSPKSYETRRGDFSASMPAPASSLVSFSVLKQTAVLF